MSQHPLNKGVNKPVELKGLVGQRYIFLLIGGLGAVFLGFIVLRIVGVNSYFSVGLALVSGLGWVSRVFALSAKYGEHGAMKLQARQRQPKRIVNRTPHLFQHLKQS